MIYIVSNGNKETGGPETLHQIANILIKHGYDASMAYYNPKSYKTPKRYEKYNVPITTSIIDSNDNILIVPESLTHILSRYKRIKKCIAWLSVDYYILSDPNTLIKYRMEANGWPKILYPLAFAVLLAKNKIQFSRYKFQDNGLYVHTYNCEYVKRFLLEHGIKPQRTLYICGPLNDVFFEKAKHVNITKKGNYILYNPTKGMKFTKRVIDYCNEKRLNVRFVPLMNMSADDVSNWMAKAKVYIDFGEFPGPERIPREAVMMGCNIITSRNGGAGNDIDVPIPSFLKFEDKEENLEKIYETIVKMIESYDEYYHYYDEYRLKVKNQKDILNNNIIQLIKVCDELYSN